ncbi:MAG: DNA and RNA helicase [Bacillota bacterium]
MFQNQLPNFGKGRILKTEMLENLRDFPRDFWRIALQSYSSGIICGADLIVAAATITVTPGIIKHGGQLYLLPAPYEIRYEATNREMTINVKLLKTVAESDFTFYKTKILLDDLANQTPDELELGRFKLREGAMLRSDYTDFFDFDTEYNTINIINSLYAGVGKSTLNPAVLRYFGQLVLKSASENACDLSFAMLCLNQERVKRDLITLYLARRLGIPIKDYTNRELYKYLTMIVREMGAGVRRNYEVISRKPGRIVVD